MKKAVFFIFFLLSYQLSAKSPLLIYYGSNAPIKYLNKFKVLILDPDIFSLNVKSLRSIKLGYLSIGEVQKSRKYFNYVKNLGILLKENPNWHGSYFVSLKGGLWKDFVVYYLIPSIISKGYDGVFLDTVDSLLSHVKDKNRIVLFINSIKQRYPFIKVVINRGFEILDKVKVDGVLLESTITSYDFKKKKYYFVKNNVKMPRKKVKVYSLDYWNLNDIKTVKKIYKIALKKGYKPFVSEITLQKLPKLLYDEDLKKFVIVNY